MCQFIETIRIEKREVCNLPYHQARMDRTLRHFFPHTHIPTLRDCLTDLPQDDGLYKARVVYGEGGIVEMGCTPYQMRSIGSMKLITCDTIDYTFKSTDRSALTALTTQKGTADEIIIVKQGFLTDTSYSNIALYDGHRWYTPRKPLLPGTMRQSLLDQGQLTERDLTPADLSQFQTLSLINAMMPLGRCEVEVKNIDR